MKVQIEYPKQNEQLKGNRYIIKISGIDCNNIRIAINDGNWHQCYYNNNEWCYNWIIDKEGKYRLKAECWNEQGERLESRTITIYYWTEQTKQLQKTERKELAEIRNGFIDTEVNFLQYPIGTLDQRFKGNSIIFKDILEDYKGGEIERIWEVSGNAKFGFPGPTAVELDMAITKLINEKTPKGEPIRKWYKTDEKELAEYMGLTKTGPLFDYIKRDLYKLFGAAIVSKKAFRQKGKEQEWGELAFHKYDAVAIKGKAIPTGVDEEEHKKSKDGIAEQIYIVLSDIYLENLNAHYTKKINYKLVKQLHGIKLKRMYLLLSYQFSNHMKIDPEGKECINYSYIEFCGRMPLKICSIKWEAERQLKKYFDLLVKHNYLEKYVFEFDKPAVDWYIRMYPGALVKYELDYCTGQLFLWDNFAKQKQLETSASNQLSDMIAQQQAERVEEEQFEKDSKEYAEWKAKINLLPAEEKEKLKSEAIKNQQTTGTIVTNLGTEIEMINIYKRQKTT